MIAVDNALEQSFKLCVLNLSTKSTLDTLVRDTGKVLQNIAFQEISLGAVRPDMVAEHFFKAFERVMSALTELTNAVIGDGARGEIRHKNVVAQYMLNHASGVRKRLNFSFFRLVNYEGGVSAKLKISRLKL